MQHSNNFGKIKSNSGTRGRCVQMSYPRIIPCLDLREGRVVTGIQFSQLRDAGDPLELASFYAREGADELFLLDIAATPASRPLTCSLIRDISSATDLCLTVGGGIDSAAVIEEMLKSGAHRVSLGSAALDNPSLIEEGARLFGSRHLVVAIDARRTAPAQPEKNARYEVYKGGGRRPTGRDAVEWAAEVERRGAAEILLTSMNTDGTRQGYDLALLKAVTAAVTLPVIASGGAGRPEHLFDALTAGGADAVLAASILHDGNYSIRGIRAFLAGKGLTGSTAVKGNTES